MIVMLVRAVVRESSEAECARICREVTEASRKEPGCAFYAVHQSRETPQEFVFYEQYRDRAALEEHRASTHFLRYREQIAPYVESREAEELTLVEEL